MPDNDQSGDLTKAGYEHHDALIVSAVPVVVPGYEIFEKLGAGAMGEVYRARHVESGREVALKLMAKNLPNQLEMAKRFEREISALSKLQHPNIAAAIGQGVANERFYLAMEFVRGPDLSNVLKTSGRLPEIEVLRIALQVARALEFAHAKAGLVHRDIKPGNLLIDTAARGRPVKVIDFGLARSTTGVDERLTLQGHSWHAELYVAGTNLRGPRDYRQDRSLRARLRRLRNALR